MRTKTFARSLTIAVALIVGLAAMALAASKKSNHPAAGPRLVELKLTFADGNWAEVHQIEGQMITVRENGKTLGITPYIRSVGEKQVDLRVFNIEEKSGAETATPVAAYSLADAPATISGVISPVSVELEEFERTTAAVGTKCCAPDCSGRIICGLCVCTKCGVCGPCFCVPIG